MPLSSLLSIDVSSLFGASTSSLSIFSLTTSSICASLATVSLFADFAPLRGFFGTFAPSTSGTSTDSVDSSDSGNSSDSDADFAPLRGFFGAFAPSTSGTSTDSLGLGASDPLSSLGSGPPTSSVFLRRVRFFGAISKVSPSAWVMDCSLSVSINFFFAIATYALGSTARDIRRTQQSPQKSIIAKQLISSR